MFAYISDHLMLDLDSPISLALVFIYQPGMPYRGVFREGGKRGSGGQGLVGNELLHHSFQAYEVWSVLQQVVPDGAGCPARDPAGADQKQACVMKETCTASLCIASRWSATRWYHQPTKARQPPTACNGCGHWQGEATLRPGRRSTPEHRTDSVSVPVAWRENLPRCGMMPRTNRGEVKDHHRQMGRVLAPWFVGCMIARSLDRSLVWLIRFPGCGMSRRSPRGGP